MKVTFPHMGNTYVALKVMFEELNAEVITPPKCSKNTLEIGTKYSPELICMPFKINMGNYIEGIKKGADTIFMISGCGPCRLGLYNTLQREILDDLGYDVEMISVEPFRNLDEIKDFLQKLKKVSNTSNYFKILSAFKKGLNILFEVDEFDDIANTIRPREIIKGEVDKLYSKFEREINSSRGYKETIRIIKENKEKLKQIRIDKNKDVLKIGIVGEIYTVAEPFINLNIEKKLGNMGIEVHKSMSSSEFLKEQMDFLPFINSDKEEIYKASEPYLSKQIGGHAQQTIGNTVRYSQKNYDGVIHLLPFTCMPEIVAQSILPTVEKEENIPVLSLILDEMTGEAGYLTRIEAFVDLLSKRKELVRNGECLSWN
ncbi:acyl-CoA dehydratase activase-related protein [Tepidibacter formicigenes]|jgi:predicted nucleotide-binding protein (sugar kinase/HSP70/actin superfamily)|uniref:Predicted nucleotide-binding protein, sugar kinase/HSP70/actin superfamily n=1 Tax=Tepidibacter formicigenes DSM 15518 TaxID=1123349 RepID=A0A1M6S7Q8_9FIRM|nr:acyl-CoA dehydratase activase-related protein [Tepidibacter formicigenes]SHK40711.1 Predicted nucleotide-binding protein, sugar kinase/HSP70/actin superfamily [Tepidibacter formicigenes DSM 15518]